MIWGTKREIPDMVTGKPDSFRTDAGKGLVSRLWGHSWAAAAGTAEGLHEDDRS